MVNPRIEGITILVAIVIVILVRSLNNWQKEKRFKVLNEKREECIIKVIRDGEEQMINIYSVVVSDVMLFEPGEIIPCDGIFLWSQCVVQRIWYNRQVRHNQEAFVPQVYCTQGKMTCQV